MPGNTAGVAEAAALAEAASMRPQRNAGEYEWARAKLDEIAAGFNEAPAKCRGIHQVVSGDGTGANLLQ